MSSVIDSRSSPLSRVLFLSETGKPMRFFIRPGATKSQLHPIISAGGGVVCRVQEPNAILLIDPEEMNQGMLSAAAQYVSSQYILDCVEKNQQLEVDDYRFRDDSVQVGSVKRKRVGAGRMGYSAEEDAAIIRFVRGRTREACGNRLWKQMEKDAITSHSWQSMKDRYRKHLSKEPLDGDIEEKSKACSIKSFTVPLQQKDSAHSSHQVDTLKPSPEKTKLQPSPEEKNSNCSPERTLPQPTADPTSPQPLPQRSRPQCSPEKQLPSPSPGRTHPQPPLNQTHPATEGHTLPALSEPTGSLILLEEIHPCASPEAAQQHSLAGEGSLVGEDVAGPNIKSTGMNRELVVTAEIVEEDEGSPSPKKRKLGILERAVLEFEDSDESDETPDIALSCVARADSEGPGKEIIAATSAVVIQENDNEDNESDNDNSESNAEPQPEKAPEALFGPPDKDKGLEVNPKNHDEVNSGEGSSKDNGEPQPGKVLDVQLGPNKDNGTKSAPLRSKVHMFIFDRESQEEEPSQPACELPFTPVPLEHATEQLRYLMKESRRGLDCVTKALLKNSGDVEAALRYLRHGPQRYLWDPRDDGLLGSAGMSLLNLENKYGKVAVARRIAFLDIE